MPRTSKSSEPPRLYLDLAKWFHLLTAPEEYKEEASFYTRLLKETALIPVKNVLEIGSGGGNNAYHMKAHFKLTLTDLSEDMLDISRKINPECEHFQGDMRNLRLGSQFDAVFIHDAIDYVLNEADLLKTFKTAFIHCKPGAPVLLCPDYVKETFTESVKTGGYDEGERGLRYMDWTWDPDKTGKSFVSHFVYITRNGKKVEYHTDEHHCGLFPKRTWLDLMYEAGFKYAKPVPYPVSMKENITPVFAGIRPKE